MPEDEAYFEGVAKNLQKENEQLRIEILKSRHSNAYVDLGAMFDELITWVEHHYIFVLVVGLVLSYVVTDAVSVVQLWRKI